MELASEQLIGIISYLLPGFFAAWIFHGFTAHPKKQPFERIVLALIFTAILQVVVSIIASIFLWIGDTFFSLGCWTPNVNLGWSLICALLLGLAASGIANNDMIHRLLRNQGWCLFKKRKPNSKWTWTRRTSFPSEWFSAFSHHDGRYITLHLSGNRRLFGWPDEWPDDCDRGHFVISQCKWLLETGESVPLLQVESMLIPVTDVEFIEFSKHADEIDVNLEDIGKNEKILIEHNKQEEANGE